MNAPAPLPAFTMLDESALDRLRELDPGGHNGLLQKVLQTFDNSLRRSLAELRAVTGGPQDEERVLGVAHQVKSSSGAVGALALSAACADVEKRLRARSPGDLMADVRRIVLEGEAALLAVRAMLRP